MDHPRSSRRFCRRSNLAREERIPPAERVRAWRSGIPPPPGEGAVVRTVSVRDHGGPKAKAFQGMVTQGAHDFLRISAKRADLQAGKQQLLLEQIASGFGREQPAV